MLKNLVYIFIFFWPIRLKMNSSTLFFTEKRLNETRLKTDTDKKQLLYVSFVFGCGQLALNLHDKKCTNAKECIVGNLAIMCQNGTIAIFMAPSRKCHCVPDCYEKLHFRPLLFSMHFWLTSLIDYHTRNAF